MGEKGNPGQGLCLEMMMGHRQIQTTMAMVNRKMDPTSAPGLMNLLTHGHLWERSHELSCTWTSSEPSSSSTHTLSTSAQPNVASLTMLPALTFLTPKLQTSCQERLSTLMLSSQRPTRPQSMRLKLTHCLKGFLSDSQMELHQLI